MASQAHVARLLFCSSSRLSQIDLRIKINASEGYGQSGVMLCDSVPGHHLFKYLQTSRFAVSFQFIPKPRRSTEFCLRVDLRVWSVCLASLGREISICIGTGNDKTNQIQAGSVWQPGNDVQARPQESLGSGRKRQ